MLLHIDTRVPTASAWHEPWQASQDVRWQVEDSAVLRFPQAVTHFSPGSYASRPYQTTSLSNLFMAGDWVKGVPHGANGLSQVSVSPLSEIAGWV